MASASVSVAPSVSSSLPSFGLAVAGVTMAVLAVDSAVDSAGGTARPRMTCPPPPKVANLDRLRSEGLSFRLNHCNLRQELLAVWFQGFMARLPSWLGWPRARETGVLCLPATMPSQPVQENSEVLGGFVRNCQNEHMTFLLDIISWRVHCGCEDKNQFKLNYLNQNLRSGSRSRSMQQLKQASCKCVV